MKTVAETDKKQIEQLNSVNSVCEIYRPEWRRYMKETKKIIPFFSVVFVINEWETISKKGAKKIQHNTRLPEALIASYKSRIKL